MFLAAGAMFVVSALNSEGSDLRPDRSSDLSSVVSDERRDVEALQTRVAQLHADVQRLTSELNDPVVDQAIAKVDELKAPAGLDPVTGPGLTVTLADSPKTVAQTTAQPPRYLVVHQQDIQAVVNAMWIGGAKAVTIQGQRVISTTGIKCSGNVVRLHGIPYGQPYVISAVGDRNKLFDAIMASHYLQVYRYQSALPDVQIGWDLQLDIRLTAPGYDGTLDLTYATPVS
jgi:uncharacterized protein YlxW (UPF0749 family)